MHKKEDLLDYDFQGWPVFRMSLREILLALGAREENGKYTFDDSNPAMDLYPVVLMDDSMGYGIDESNICEASLENDNITVFRARVPDDKTRKRLMKEWEEDELEIEVLRAKKAKQD